MSNYYHIDTGAPYPDELNPLDAIGIFSEQVGIWAEGKKHLSLDTETSGLMPYHGDKVFAITISDGKDAIYFNVSGRDKLPDCLLKLFGDKTRTWKLHNAKFDLHQLWCTFHLNGLAGEVWDTAVGARLECP